MSRHVISIADDAVAICAVRSPETGRSGIRELDSASAPCLALHNASFRANESCVKAKRGCNSCPSAPRSATGIRISKRAGRIGRRFANSSSGSRRRTAYRIVAFSLPCIRTTGSARIARFVLAWKTRRIGAGAIFAALRVSTTGEIPRAYSALLSRASMTATLKNPVLAPI